MKRSVDDACKARAARLRLTALSQVPTIHRSRDRPPDASTERRSIATPVRKSARASRAGAPLTASTVVSDKGEARTADAPGSAFFARFRRRALGVFPAIQNPGYRTLLQGSVGTSIAFWMQMTIEGWLIYELTRSPFFLSLAAICRSVPMLLLSPFAGVLADRIDRKRMLVVTQGFTMTLALVMATLVISGLIQPWHLLVTASMSGIAIAASVPSRYGLTALVVPKAHLANAVALHATTVSGSRILGPQIAGVLIAGVGAGASYLIQAATFAWALFNFRRIRTPQVSRPRSSESFLQNLQSGVRLAVRDPRLRGVYLVGVLYAVFIYPYTQFLPVVASDVLKIGAAGLGLLMAANGIGGVVGAFIAAATSGFRRRGLMLLASGLTTSTGVLLFSLSNAVWLSFACLMLAGLGGGLIMATSSAITQLIVPDEFRGRMSSVQLVIWGLMPVGTLPLAAIATAAGAPAALTVSGALGMSLVAIAIAGLPNVRRLQC